MIVTGPIPAQSPFIPVGAKIVVGAVAPASPDPIPLVLLQASNTGCANGGTRTLTRLHWLRELRKSAGTGDDDE